MCFKEHEICRRPTDQRKVMTRINRMLIKHLKQETQATEPIGLKNPCRPCYPCAKEISLKNHKSLFWSMCFCSIKGLAVLTKDEEIAKYSKRNGEMSFLFRYFVYY